MTSRAERIENAARALDEVQDNTPKRKGWVGLYQQAKADLRVALALPEDPETNEEVVCDMIHDLLWSKDKRISYTDMVDVVKMLKDFHTKAVAAASGKSACAHTRAIPTKPRSDDTAVHYVQWCPDCGAINLWENRPTPPATERVTGWFPAGHQRFR